jgi:hypothetical protein
VGVQLKVTIAYTWMLLCHKMSKVCVVPRRCGRAEAGDQRRNLAMEPRTWLASCPSKRPGVITVSTETNMHSDLCVIHRSA